MKATRGGTAPAPSLLSLIVFCLCLYSCYSCYSWSLVFDLGQRLARRLDRLLDVLLGVRDGVERRLELAARQVHAAVHHRPEEAAEPRRVARLGAVVVRHRPRREE